MNYQMKLMLLRNPKLLKQFIIGKAPTFIKKTKEKKNKNKGNK